MKKWVITTVVVLVALLFSYRAGYISGSRAMHIAMSQGHNH